MSFALKRLLFSKSLNALYLVFVPKVVQNRNMSAVQPFSDIQNRIYSFLIRHPQSRMIDISRGLKIHRPRLYSEMEKMLKQEYVVKIYSKKSELYSAADPKNISESVSQGIETMTTYLKSLAYIYNQHNKNVHAEIFQGKESIKKGYEILVRSIPKNGLLFRIESMTKEKHAREYYPPIYMDRAFEGGDITKYVITNVTTKQRRTPKLNRHSRLLSKDVDSFEHNIAQIIGLEHVLFLDYKSESAVLIHGKSFAEFQIAIFKSLYSKL